MTQTKIKQVIKLLAIALIINAHAYASLPSALVGATVGGDD